MTKEEFVERFIHDQYLRKLKERRKYFWDDANIHEIDNCKRVKRKIGRF